MKKGIFTINVELLYESEEDKHNKVSVITDLLSGIVKSENKIKDMKKINNFVSIINGKKQKKSYYILQGIAAFIFVLFLSTLILGITIYDKKIVTNSYLGGNYAYGYYIEIYEGTDILEYGHLELYGCNENACTTSKGVVLKRFIDHYSFF